MKTAYAADGWVVFRYDLDRPQTAPCDELLVPHWVALDELTTRGRRNGQRFLIGPDGRPDIRINAFFGSTAMLQRSPLTWKKYAHSVALWLNFLLSIDQTWDRATEDHAEHFKEWRITEPRNPQLVRAGTFKADLSALREFYKWASKRFGVTDPVAATDGYDLKPRGARRRNVKWLDPSGFTRWRDVGVRGMSLDGRPDAHWGGRNGQRDTAFVDGLYGTGLRLTEWASVLLPELPQDIPSRGYRTCQLGASTAKGSIGRDYWIPRRALLGVLDYIEGARARVVRQAQTEGRYAQLKQLRLVVKNHPGYLTIVEPNGQRARRAIDTLTPDDRSRLFQETDQGLEPLALWLNEDGQPRRAHGWQRTFEQANKRLAGLGLAGFRATAHMLRHSFALRWYSVGLLLYQHRVAHLTEDETRDFRKQFGDTWNLVATMLGHSNPLTTREYYLEPFVTLDVELLLQHAQEAEVDKFLTVYLADHPAVRTDPLSAQ